MGALAVLHPQDFLRDRHASRIDFQTKPRGNRNPNPNPNPIPKSTRSNRRKRSPEKNNRKSRDTTADDFPVKTLVLGQVKILKRGEELTAVKNRVGEKKKDGDSDGLPLPSTDRLASEPNMVSKESRLGNFYAGSAFITSPPPSSLPLPGFFTKKCVLVTNDDARTDLLRRLRLDLS